MSSKSVGSQVVEVDFDSPIFDGAVADEDFDTPTTITTTNNPKAAKPKPEDDDLLDLSDEATLDKLSTGGFLRLRPEGHNVIRVAFFKPAVHEKTHYSQERSKTFRCLQSAGSICCKQLGEARDAIGVLAVQYVGASTKDGALKKGTDPDLRAGYVTLSKSALVSMRRSLPEGASLYSVDWTMWKRANGIGYEYAQRPLAYKALGLEKQVEELIAPYKDGVKLRQRVAKPMSVAEVTVLITGEPPELDDVKQLEDMETL
jgi:hypothetical protein